MSESSSETEAAREEAIEAAKAARVVIGQVISDKMQKTVTVRVDRMVKHPLYKKYVRLSTKFHAHDENNECKVGDKVSIEQCRPLSKTKVWRLHRILERAK